MRLETKDLEEDQQQESMLKSIHVRTKDENLSKVDNLPLIQPNIIMFASASITPSNNFKG